jgi:hypothetical protein
MIILVTYRGKRNVGLLFVVSDGLRRGRSVGFALLRRGLGRLGWCRAGRVAKGGDRDIRCHDGETSAL